MLITILSWAYIGYICLAIGFGTIRLLEKILHVTFKRNASHYVVTGIAVITVYVEYFSLFYKISALAHILMLLTAVLISWFFRKDFSEIFRKFKKVLFSWEGFFYFGIVLLFAFFASRGDFHTDTGIYHGQAIRWYEEYGIVKGLGNVQLHFAYNSAYLAFASIFSMFWLFGISLHTTTGFMEIVLCIYVCSGLKGIKNRSLHYGDLCRMGALIYLLNILCRSMSPATDFGTMILVLYVIIRWVEVFENKGSVADYALLAVLSVLVMTFKLSAATLLVLAFFPAYYLIKRKEWKNIAAYIVMGVLILLPYLLRNIILSGWLIYPFAGIDLFSFDWKIPESYLQVDSAQITVWGRCIFDIAKLDMPAREWIPIWWEAQERYGKMLIYAAVIGAGLGLFNTVYLKLFRKKTSGAILILYLTLLSSLVLWFAMAPFIRYGLAFLLVLPLLAIGETLSFAQKGIVKITTGVFIALIFFSLSPFWDQYISDAGVFVKHNVTEPYYIMPKDYERSETEKIPIGNTEFYVPVAGEVISFYDFPGSCYDMMVSRSEMRGESIKDGFRPK